MKAIKNIFIGFALALAFSAVAVVNQPPSLPAGAILDYAGTTPPAGFVICDGSAISRQTGYYAKVGTAWGIGNGTTTVNVPDLRRRVTVGSGGTGTATLAATVASTGGEEAHALTIAELAAHTHSDGSEVWANMAGGSQVQFTPVTSATYNITTQSIGGRGVSTTSSTGSGTAHNVRDPSAVVLKICKT